MKKTIVITGAGSGIGSAVATQAAKQGYALALWDLNIESLQKVKGDLSEAYTSLITVVACDVSNPESVIKATEQTIAEHKRIDCLVNNAGIAHIGNVENTTPDDLDRLYQVNIKGVYNCLHQIIPVMKEQGTGAIVNLASIASKVGIEDRFAYSMTKGAVLTMSLSVARDYVSSGIRCNCVCPARVHTPFVDNFLAKNYPGQEAEMMKKLSAGQPIGRMGTPEEVAKLILYLCSDDASFITGSAYDIDGGFTLLR